MHQEDDAAFSKYPAFEAKIRRIINKQRKSIPSPASPARFVSAHKYNARDNEDTFLAEILPLVISTRRTVASRVAMDSNGVPEMGEEWTLEHYADSGLVTKHNLEFLRDFLPSRKDWSSLEPAVIKAMAKVNGMTNPKPDRTFGTRIDKYRFADDVTISHDIAKLLEVVPRAHNPFFIIEGKSTKGDKAEAENQACRSGAAITNAARMLRAKIGQASPTGVDDQTYIFSATISPGLLDLWVHWVDEPQGAKHPTFHMNKLKTVAIGDEEAFGPLRRMLHNILDWGCADRFDEMVVIYDMIVALERDNEAKMDAATKKREIT